MLPITIIVLIVNFIFIQAPNELITRFLIGSLLIIAGLTIFLWGAELGISEFGDITGEAIAKLNSLPKVFMAGLFLGFLITIAEPDLLILANQIAQATGHFISASTIVLGVSVGVGLMIALGFLRILKNIGLASFFSITYILFFILMIFVIEEFHGIAFDASGATTGAMTTPFILALGIGVSRMKGSKQSEYDSFGLVGIASCGPILAMLIMSFVFTSMKSIPMESSSIHQGILGPLITNFKGSLRETATALFPLIILFLILNYKSFQLNPYHFKSITKGFIYTFVGLVIFLTGAYSGFIDFAKLIGIELGQHHHKILPVIGFIFGMIIVLAEPAVYLLSKQVEEVTGGNITRKMIMISLSIGVALAVTFSIIRIWVYDLKLWMFLILGFGASIMLAHKIPAIFIGIAFDSGGVASGPMTATFLLAFTQGIAEVTKGADLLIDGFGIIAMVAMMPVLSISILGYIYKLKTKKGGKAIE